MFFENSGELESIAKKVGTSVFVMPEDEEVLVKNSLLLQPEEKSLITVEQVKLILERIKIKQLLDLFIIVRPADLLGDAAANALLKNLEEPQEKVHFVLITNNLSKILPTILSRASIYFLKDKRAIDGDIVADKKVKDLARRLIVAKPIEIVDIVEEIAKKKDGVRVYAMEVLAVAIEMLYKSYLKTGKGAFLTKIPKFLEAYECVSKNGHVKLQIVANLC